MIVTSFFGVRIDLTEALDVRENSPRFWSVKVSPWVTRLVDREIYPNARTDWLAMRAFDEIFLGD